MEQKETQIDHLFQEFQTRFEQASPEEKKLLAAQFVPWVVQQANSLNLPLPDHAAIDVPGSSQAAGQAKSDEFQQKNIQRKFQVELQKLVQNEIHLNQIADNIEQVCWLQDIRSSRILYVSPAFEKVWGRTIKSLYANPSILIESVHPEDRVQVMVARPHNGHKPYNQVYRILHADGSLRWISARIFTIRNNSGEAHTMFCVAEDITDQKQIELALHKTLDRTREQFNLSHKMSLARKPEAVLRTLMSAEEMRSAQRAALLFFENPKVGPARGLELRAAWQSSLNLPPWFSETSLYEEPALWDLLHPIRTVVISGIRSDPRITPLVRDFLLEGHIQTLVIFPLVASGNWLGSLLVYYNQEQVFDHIKLRHLKVLVDQSTITLYNLQLLEVEAESRHEAERANEIKTQFLAMISHELRTPLTSILGFTTTLLAEDVTWTPDEQSDFIHTIQQEANRLQELIDHLLDLSRLEAGMLPISMEIHSIQEILNDAQPQLNSLVGMKKLSIQLPANLPPVFVDAKRIAQVLVNLVRNASTHASAGDEISITASVRSGFVQLNVIDHGPGIPAAEHKKVFKAFRRGANVENGLVQGAGLGLAICKGLVEAHGGRIWIKKKSTPGATICFTIPLVAETTSTNRSN